MLAIAATFVATVIAVPVAVAVTRFEFRGKSAIETVFMSPLILPHLVVGAALLQYGTSIGLVRSFTALLVGHIVIIVPFVIRSILPGLADQKRMYEDASRDLGAGAIATFFLVVLPQIRGGLICGAVLAFISSWINVELSIFNTTAALNTIPVKLFNYVQYTIDPTIAAVSSVTIIVAALLIALLDVCFGLNVLPDRK